MLIVLVFGQFLCNAIGQHWYRVIGEQSECRTAKIVTIDSGKNFL